MTARLKLRVAIAAALQSAFEAATDLGDHELAGRLQALQSENNRSLVDRIRQPNTAEVLS